MGTHTADMAPSAPANGTAASGWSIEAARQLYNIEGWGAGYFDINAKGHVVVRPDADQPDRELDLFELEHDLEEQGVALPVLLRFSDILRSRIDGAHTGIPDGPARSSATPAATPRSIRSRSTSSGTWWRRSCSSAPRTAWVSSVGASRSCRRCSGSPSTPTT